MKRRQQFNEWESDSFIVLEAGESLLHVNVQQRKRGDGMNRHTQLSKETAAGKQRPDKLLPTSLRAITTKAKSDKKHRFGGLYSLLNTSNLRAAYYEINPKAAAGIDEIDHTEFGKNLNSHVAELVSELRKTISCKADPSQTHT